MSRIIEQRGFAFFNDTIFIGTDQRNRREIGARR